MKYYVLSLFIIVITLTTCQENELWRQPTNVSFNLSVNPYNSINSPGNLTFNEGYIILSNVLIWGELENENNFSYFREFPNGLQIPFMHVAEIPELKFALPQGQYKKLKIKFTTFEVENEDNMQVKGFFEYNSQNPAIVNLEIEASRTFEIIVTDEMGNESFELINGEFLNPEVILNPSYWFRNITSFLLNESNATVVGNATVITINNTENSNIFGNVESEIGGGAKSIIKKEL